MKRGRAGPADEQSNEESDLQSDFGSGSSYDAPEELMRCSEDDFYDSEDDSY